MGVRFNPALLARIDRTTWALIAAFATLGVYLLWDRGGPLLAALAAVAPWLLILACPLLHILMHRGHGGHGAQSGHDGPADDIDSRLAIRKRTGETPPKQDVL